MAKAVAVKKSTVKAELITKPDAGRPSVNAVFTSATGVEVSRVKVSRDVLASCQPELQEPLTQVHSLLMRGKNQLLQTYYDVGVVLQTVYEKHSKGGISSLQEHLFAVMGDAAPQLDALYHAQRFAERYSLRDVQRLITSPLSWTHVRCLVNVADPKLRARLQTEAIENKWTVATLTQHIKSAQTESGNAEARGAGGRPINLPKDQKGLCYKAVQTTEVFLKASSEYFEEITSRFEALEDTPSTEWPEATVESLDQTFEAARKLLDTATENYNSIASVRERLFELANSSGDAVDDQAATYEGEEVYDDELANEDETAYAEAPQVQPAVLSRTGVRPRRA